MKKLLLLFICPFFLSAQSVNIPDANFKTLLIAAGVDTNGNGQIELYEAQAMTALSIVEEVDYPIYSLEGIESFSNLVSLIISIDHVSSLDFGGNNVLQSLSIGETANSNLSFLHLHQLSALTHLSVDIHSLNDFSISDCPVLTSFVMQETPLPMLDLTSFPLLEFVKAEGPASVNVSGLSHLTELHCDYHLSALNVSGCNALAQLSIMGAFVPELDCSGLSALQSLTLTPMLGPGSAPAHLNFAGCTSLVSLIVDLYNIETLNLMGCSALQSLSAIHNSMTNINLAGCTSLQYAFVNENQLTTFDATDCHSLTSLDLWENPLQFVFLKNGSDEHLSLIQYPYPQFMCMDENEIAEFLNIMNPLPGDNLNCSGYCSFTPGGDYNTIEGDVHYDLEGDGCDASDPPARMQIGYSDGTTQYYTFTQNGHYNLYAGAGNIQMLGDYTPYWTASAPSPIYFADSQNHVAIQDFCLTPNGSHHDVSVYGLPHNSLRPGFDFVFDIQVYNKGTQTESGAASVTFDNSRISVVSLPMGATVSGNEVTMNYNGLLPFERKDILITFHLNTPSDTPPVNAGDVLDFTVNAPLSDDESVFDNTMDSHELVVNSLDPNEIICAEGDVLPTLFIGDDLHYIINFENTGTANAENVVIKSLLDPSKYDISTLQPMGASHNVNTVITGNKVEFQFQGIDLAPNEYGYVAYSIKSKNTLAAGDSVSSSASIYFDFNAPVVTNTATTTFEALGVPSHGFEERVTLYPNPAVHTVEINSPFNIQRIKIIDAQGRTLRQIPATENQVSVPLDGLATGVYEIVVETAAGRAVKKLLKS
jgi:hypothetical protein